MSPNHSSFRSSQAPPSSAFYLGGGSNQDFNEEPQSHQLLMQSKTFHGSMQLPDLQSNTNASSSAATAAAANLFNLGFFSNGSITSTINNSNDVENEHSHLLITGQLNNGNARGEPGTLFSGNLMSDHIRMGISSIYNTSMQSESMLPQMSATALLQKAAQIGAATHSGSSLLRGFGSSSSSGPKPNNFQASFRSSRGSGGGEGLRSQVENESHFQDIMNSFVTGSSGIFGSGGASPFDGNCTSGGHDQGTGFDGFNEGLCNIDEAKYSHNLSASSLGGSDGLTRDFLGVGGMVRKMSGALSQREHHGIDIGSLDPELKSASSSRSFAGGNLQ